MLVLGRSSIGVLVLGGSGIGVLGDSGIGVLDVLGALGVFGVPSLVALALVVLPI